MYDIRELLHISGTVLFGLLQMLAWGRVFRIVPPTGSFQTVDIGKVIVLAVLSIVWILFSRMIGKKLKYGVIGDSVLEIAIPVVWILTILRMPVINKNGLLDVCSLGLTGTVTVLFVISCMSIEKENANGRLINILIPGVCTLCGTVAFCMYSYYNLLPLMEQTNTSLAFAVRATFADYGRLQTILLVTATGFILLSVRLVSLYMFRKRQRQEVNSMLNELWNSSGMQVEDRRNDRRI